MEQLQLGGFSSPDTGPRYNLFFALWPDAALRADIEETVTRLAPSLRGQGRALKPHRYHLTVRWLGVHALAHEAVLDAACQVAEGVSRKAFDLPLERAAGFASAQVCWLGPRQTPPALTTLRASLDLGLARSGIPFAPGEALTPHVTVVRDCHRPWPEQILQPALPWRVDRLVLVGADLQRHHAYTILGEWSLLD